MVVIISDMVGTIMNSMVKAKQLHLIIISFYVHNNRITTDFLYDIVLDDLRDEYYILREETKHSSVTSH